MLYIEPNIHRASPTYTYTYVECRSPALGLKEATGECSTKHRSVNSVFQQHEAQTQPHSLPCMHPRGPCTALLRLISKKCATDSSGVPTSTPWPRLSTCLQRGGACRSCGAARTEREGHSWAGGKAVQAGWECVQCRRVHGSQQQRKGDYVYPPVEWCSTVAQGVHHCVREGGL